MILSVLTAGQALEGGMLVCFGISWPVDILRTWRTRRTEGKSLGFMVMVLIGYCSGLVAKFVKASAPDARLETVTLLYALNLLFVAIDIGLYMRFRQGKPSAHPA